MAKAGKVPSSTNAKIGKAVPAEERRARVVPKGESRKGYGGIRAASNNFENNFFFKENTSIPIQLVRPGWDEGPSVFRFFPYIDVNNPSEFAPYKVASDDYRNSDFGIMIPTAAYVGSDARTKVSFFLYRHDDPTYDRRANPYELLYAKLIGCKRAQTFPPNPSWIYLLDRGAGKDGAAVSPPKMQYLFQGLTYQHNGECFVLNGEKPRGASENDPIQVFQLGPSCGQTLTKMFNARNEQWTGSTDDFKNAFKYGDPVRIGHGRFIVIYTNEKPFVLPGEQMPQIVTRREDKRYAARLLSKWPVAPGRELFPSLKHMEDFVFNRVQWWSEIINYMPDEQQTLVLARAFENQPGLIEWAILSERPELRTSELSAFLSKRTSGSSAAVAPDATDDAEDEYDGGISGAYSDVEEEEEYEETSDDLEAADDEGADVSEESEESEEDVDDSDESESEVEELEAADVREEVESEDEAEPTDLEAAYQTLDAEQEVSSSDDEAEEETEVVDSDEEDEFELEQRKAMEEAERRSRVRHAPVDTPAPVPPARRPSPAKAVEKPVTRPQPRKVTPGKAR